MRVVCKVTILASSESVGSTSLRLYLQKDQRVTGTGTGIAVFLGRSFVVRGADVWLFGTMTVLQASCFRAPWRDGLLYILSAQSYGSRYRTMNQRQLFNYTLSTVYTTNHHTHTHLAKLDSQTMLSSRSNHSMTG